MSNLTRLRYWFVGAIILVVVIVTGFLTYGKWMVRHALKNAAKAKLGIEYQQSTQGFSLSKSQGGHTLFTVRASNAVTYKEGGRAQLNDVNITVYGREGDRYDQIYGKQFEYDPKTHLVNAPGEVQIDLQSADPNVNRTDQTPPPELKNPIHLKTSALVFNEATGAAHTDNQVEFKVPQAEGTAEGVTYDSKARTLTLAKNVHMRRNGPQAAEFWAHSGVIIDQPRRAVFEQARIVRPTGTFDADHLTVYLTPDNSIDHVVAVGNVHGDSTGNGKTKLDFHSQQGEVVMAKDADVPHSAVFTGAVNVNATGNRPMHAQANRVTAEFTPDGQVKIVHALESVHMTQPPAQNAKANAQSVELAADAVDFFVRNGDTLERAETIGKAQIIATPVQTQVADKKSPSKTTATAGKFVARFNKQGQIENMHGAPDAKVVSSTPGQPDATTTSQQIDVAFEPDGSITHLVQQGSFQYHEAQKTGDRAAYADSATYVPQSDTLRLTGSPRVVDGGMTTTADTVLLKRTTGEAEAQNNVKTTYNDLKPNPQGALLASSAPVHVTAHNMTAQRNSGLAKYTGNARLWQEANIIEAPTITFDRDRRQVTAAGSGKQLVSTILVQQDKTGKVTPVNIHSQRLIYEDNAAVAHFEGGVTVRSSGGNMDAGKADVYLAKTPGAKPAQPGPAQLDHIIAETNVKVEQQGRRATGGKLVYTPSDDKFVMTGGSPTITDPEHGTIAGTSLTFFRADDRVLVEGGASRTVTTTRVAR